MLRTRSTRASAERRAHRRPASPPLRRGRAPARFVVLPRDKKRLGARGSAWPCVSETAAAARHCSRLVALREGWFRSGLVRACLSILELCEWFRDSSQASGASQRVQRAPVASLLEGCDGWPCTPWPSRGRSRGVTLLWVVPHLPSARERLSGSRERAGRLFYRASAVRVRSGVVSCLFCAVRRAWPAGATRDGVDSLCAGSGASRFGAARPVPAARARIFPEDRRACDPNP